MKKLRIIKDTARRGPLNMAIDSALIESASENYLFPVLRLYSWVKPCVSAGYNQKIDETVNISKCADDSVDIVRRVTGGGTVYHDREITYSLFVSEQNFSYSVPDSFVQLLHPIVKALNDIKIPAVFKPANDILVNSRKISGNSQIRRKGILLQHGTIILENNSDKMFSYIKRIDGKILPTSLMEAAEQINISFASDQIKNQLEERIISRFSEFFCIDHYFSTISKDEMELAEKIEEKIFKSLDWNEKRMKFNINKITGYM